MSIHIGGPQIIILALYLPSLAMNIYKHDKPRDGKYNGWACAIVTLGLFAVLAWGGFWS